MVPDWNGLKPGYRLPDETGTAVGDGCCVCGGRFTIRYYTAKSDGPYCAAHFPQEPANG